MLLLGKVMSTCDQEYRSNVLHLCHFLVCSGKSQLVNYVNAHCLQISIWTWFMSYHVETTLCHDITTYDVPEEYLPVLWGTVHFGQLPLSIALVVVFQFCDWLQYNHPRHTH